TTRRGLHDRAGADGAPRRGDRHGLPQSRGSGQAASGSRGCGRRGVPRRDQGGGDRRRCRGGPGARCRGRLRRQRGRFARWRAEPRRSDPAARRHWGAGVSHPRHSEPLPLGTPDQPYSKGLMARALVAIGVPLGRAYELAKRIEVSLQGRGEQSVELEHVEELAVEVLGEDEGFEAVRRLRRFRELQELDLPVIVLIGGATGTGKSTVATEAAYRLGITRVTSTDFVRQTMRAFFSKEFMPSIHYSSFEAAAGLREPEQAEDPVIAGFLEQ